MSEVFVEVLLDQNLKRALDYRVPPHWIGQVDVGVRVEVPLKSSLKKATIVKVKNSSAYGDVKSLSKILSKRKELSENQWKLANWMSQYYCTPMQKVLRCFIPGSIRKEVKQKSQLFVRLADTHDKILEAICHLRGKAPKQADALEKIIQEPKGALFTALGIEKATLTALVKKKLVTTEHVCLDDDLLLEEEFFPTFAKTLNDEQKTCFEKICHSLDHEGFAAHLIFGITGSGKTEIYMQAIQKTLDSGKSALLLVPEVSLTSQTIERLRSRFSEKIAILHHRRSLGERTQAWLSLQDGTSRLAIGARSALFCPMQKIGLIIVDEEHDGSYKQTEEMPCYHARDVAVMRAHMEQCTVLLGSATPAIESRYNAEIGKYHYHELKSRGSGAKLPKVRIIDMQRAFELNKGFTHFSEELLFAMKKRLEQGEQTLLLLNKRGYHRQQICSACKHIEKCPRCDLSLTFHKKDTLLQCHLCGLSKAPPRQCPACKEDQTLQFKGFGTEHVERSLHAMLPEARTLRMDRDTTQKKTSHEEMFKQFRSHKADILIGTQMIAKGFHFPCATLVGVLNADSALCIPDFRAPEYAFQLLTQVAGRAGRADLEGEVIIQTFIPEHETLTLASNQDYPTFYSSTIAERRLFGYPPFCRLVKLLFSDQDETKARILAEKTFESLKAVLPEGTELLPLAGAGHAKIKDFYRFQIIIKTLKINELCKILTAMNLPAKIDIDPLSTYF